MAVFGKNFLSGNGFKAALAIFCCYDFDANPSVAVEKIAADEKDYYKWSSCVIVCCIATAYCQWH